MWQDMFVIEIPAPEKILRTIAVYAGLAILLRLAGKRDLAQLNTFDLVVVLLLANVLQNAVIGNDYSLVGGLLGAAVLMVVNSLWVHVAAAVPWLSRLTEGRPTELVRNGEIVSSPARSGLRRADIIVALRRQGAESIDEVERATLTPRGSIVVDLYPWAQNATVRDVQLTDRTLDVRLAELGAKIDALAARMPPHPG